MFVLLIREGEDNSAMDKAHAHKRELRSYLLIHSYLCRTDLKSKQNSVTFQSKELLVVCVFSVIINFIIFITGFLFWV